MARDYATVKRIQNERRLVNRFVLLKKREKEIEKELKIIKTKVQCLYCIGADDDEKVLLEGTEKDLEAGAFSIVRNVSDKEKCFNLLDPLVRWDCLSFSVPAIELALSSVDFKSVIRETYGDHRIFRMKKKGDYDYITSLIE